MRQKTIGGLTDQFGQLVEPGKWYGVREACDPPSRAVAAECVGIIRETVWFRNKAGTQFDVPNRRDGGGYRLIRLDEQLREVVSMPREALERRAAEFERMLILVAMRAKRRRQQQADLIAEVIALWGVVPPPDDLEDMLATFIRDDDSHITPATLAAEYRSGLMG